MITTKSNNKFTVVSVEKYEDYQNNRNENEQQNNNKVTTKEQQNNTNKNVKNDKKVAVAEITEYYEKNIGLITPAIAETLFSYLDDGLEYQLIIEAIKIATLRNNRNCKYIQGILNDWDRKNYKVLADVQEEQKLQNKLKSKEVDNSNVDRWLEKKMKEEAEKNAVQ